jgi:hypothetical protein
LRDERATPFDVLLAVAGRSGLPRRTPRRTLRLAARRMVESRRDGSEKPGRREA